MRNVALALVAALLLPASARALDSRDVAALVAMPLAVAAASEVSGVPASDLVNVVAAMNRAYVPPPQFVEVVRYVPVALVEEPQPFVSWVRQEVDSGVTGDVLAYRMADRIQTYGVTGINVANPPDVVVIDRYDYIPPVVTTQLAPVDPVALVAMPLAVAAVSQLTNVPAFDLVRLVAALNGAYVPPAQFVEIVRYSPVVLADYRYAPELVPFVVTQVDRGIVGMPLAETVASQYQTWGVPEINVVHPEIRQVVSGDILPPLVTARVAGISSHPHGGPPGQLKKELGLQTGAEVVHGESPAGRVVERSVRGGPMEPRAHMERSASAYRAPHVQREHGNPHRVAVRNAAPQQHMVMNRGAASEHRIRPHGQPQVQQQFRPQPQQHPQINHGPGAAAAMHGGPGRAAAHGGGPMQGNPGHGNGKGKGH